MTVSNIYNQPGSSSEYFTLANNTAAVLAANLGKCKLGVESDTNNLGYTDINGTYHSLNLTAVRSISTNQTALASDNTIECTATLTLSLYQASGSGRELTIIPPTYYILICRCIIIKNYISEWSEVSCL